MKLTNPFTLALALLTACSPSSKTESESLREARATYKNMMQVLEDGTDIAQEKLEKMGIKADSLLAQGDSILASKLREMNHKLDSLHEELENIKIQAEEMYAHSALMTEGDTHEHHHHHGATVDYTEFSDDQLLDLQKEMKSQVESLTNKIEEIQIAIQHADTTETQP